MRSSEESGKLYRNIAVRSRGTPSGDSRFRAVVFTGFPALTLFRYTDTIREKGGELHMIINDLLARRKMTRYRLAVDAGIPHSTLSDICSGKTKLEKCSAETVFKIAKVLDVPMELLTESGILQTERENSYEYGLPEYLQHDLDAYKEGLKNHSSLIDCLWDELYGSINIAEINDRCITSEHANYLRNKFLYGGAEV